MSLFLLRVTGAIVQVVNDEQNKTESSADKAPELAIVTNSKPAIGTKPKRAEERMVVFHVGNDIAVEPLIKCQNELAKCTYPSCCTNNRAFRDHFRNHVHDIRRFVICGDDAFELRPERFIHFNDKNWNVDMIMERFWTLVNHANKDNFENHILRIMNV